MPRPSGPTVCHCCGAEALTEGGLRIVNAVESSPEPMSWSEIASAAGVNVRTVRRVVLKHDYLFAYGPRRKNGEKTVKISSFSRAKQEVDHD